MKNQVFFCQDISSQSINKLYDLIKPPQAGKIGIKLHFGEKGNKNFLPPKLIKPLAKKISAHLIESNVLYVSERRYTDSHIKLARQHGFDFAPIDILDKEYDLALPVTNSKYFDKAYFGQNISNYDTILAYSHFKGHGLSGFGGAIKNVGMGMASVAGKMAMHASTIPTIKADKCIVCGKCVELCPPNAITLQPVKISAEKCIGCGTCVGVCPESVFGIPWDSTSKSDFIIRMLQYTKAIIKYRPIIYINVLANISQACDCMSSAPAPFTDDIGIVAGTDIVAVEKASLDLLAKQTGQADILQEFNQVDNYQQIDLAVKLGLGSKEYELVIVK